MGDNINLLKGEFTRKPEELPENKLKQAQGLARILTDLRKFLYLFFAVIQVIVVLIVTAQYTTPIIQNIFVILSVLYSLFKVRDYIRGTI